MATLYVASHDECGYVSKPTTKGRAENALRRHSCHSKRRAPTASTSPAPVQAAGQDRPAGPATTYQERTGVSRSASPDPRTIGISQSGKGNQ